ncbi:MAG TPA: thiamine pyrophosphate-dependent dehydrogenase E1 component subunit alpha [Gemmatimonadales bacterium]|nr:thiamine pyrophosphate-dependent dehydrogenase E1 component subunit alpha [Gemmatimonadales bacterium]
MTAPDARRPGAESSVAPPARGDPETGAAARAAAVRSDAMSGLPAGLSRAQLLELYYFMRLTRSLEERLTNLYRQGKVIGGLFRSLGQEADSVGSAYALDRSAGDFLSPLIRNLGSLLVMGARPVDVLRQYMAKAASPTRGRELNLHFGDLERGFLGQISHLGDMVPVMAGITLTFRMRGERRVGLVYVGDGAMSTGAFHEGINLAASQRLPLVVIAENNGYAYSTRLDRQTAVKHLADKAKAYGIPGERADGNDVLAVYEVTRRAVERARAGEGVTLIELLTYRRKGHAEHDNQSYVPKDELARWERDDPLDRYAALLDERAWAAADERAAVDARVSRELDAAVAEAEAESLPEPATALESVYAHPPVQPTAWYRESSRA